jgi:Glycosyltransferase
MGAQGNLKVGIFFNARVEQGGLYQYALTLVHCLHQFEPEFQYSLYLTTLEDFPLSITAENWNCFKFSRFTILWHMAFEVVLNRLAKSNIQLPFRLIPVYAAIEKDQPDVMLYVKPSPQVFQWNYRAIFPIHDLQHRLQRNFPEVSDKGEFNRREYLYTYSVEKAAAILTDSETGKEDVISLYHGSPEKVYPLPYIAPPFRSEETGELGYDAIKQKYSLPETYLFYPATFWAHKNHARLIRAIHVLANEKGQSIPLVLTGSRKHEYQVLQDLVDELGLQHLVLFIGFVPDSDLLQIYRHALALVMPTFFGPTNIPVLEAWAAGCPVITSDIRGIREQVGDAGLLVDPTDVHSLADAIWRITSDAALRKEMIDKGYQRVQAWTPEKFAHSLASTIRQSVV